MTRTRTYGKWLWISQLEARTDLPHDGPWPYGEGWEQKSGPPRPPRYGYDEATTDD